MTYDEAIEALRKRCENGDGAPDHSEQPPQWKVPDDCKCQFCEIRAELANRDDAVRRVVEEMASVCYVPGVESHDLTVAAWKRVGNAWAARLRAALEGKHE